MLSAHAIYRLLIDDEQPVPPPDDPNQLSLDIDGDADEIDTKSEVMRYAEEPFRVPGSGPTDLYHTLTVKLNNRPRKKVANNTYVVRQGNGALAVQFHQTHILVAFPDGKVVVNSGGWKHGSGGHGHNPGGRTEPGTTTMARMDDWLCSGWQIYKLKGEWYWFNRSGPRHWEADIRYPYTDGDTIFPDGSLKIQAHPIYLKRRRRKV